MDRKQIAMCYNIATPDIWREIFCINTLNDITDRLNKIYSNINHKNGNYDWSKDQKDFYMYVMKWNEKTNKFINLCDNETNFKRLDRSNFKLDTDIKNQIIDGYYSDYHTCRPYLKYKSINDTILDLLIEQKKCTN